MPDSFTVTISFFLQKVKIMAAIIFGGPIIFLFFYFLVK